MAAKRSYQISEVRGSSREEQRHLQGAAAVWAQEGERSYSTFKVRSGDREKIPLVQGKEQGLHFAATAMKRYPCSR